jgi:hypothetical protein
VDRLILRLQDMTENNKDESDIYANPVYVRVMPDYMSNCIWHFDGLHMDPEELPVSEKLKTQLAQWADWYNINDDFKPEAERKNRLNWKKFNAEGVEITRAIKRELPHWTVVWHDDKKLTALIRVGGESPARHLYEFEVLPGGVLGPPPTQAPAE